MHVLIARLLPGLLALLLVACGGVAVSPSGTPSPSASAAASAPMPSPSPVAGAVEPAPGSDSSVYEPNPGAIVVGIDAGHGGCLDWGVPDPSERGEELAEKKLNLEIARALRDRLTAEGIGVVMIRDGDDALAGDNAPAYGCDGPPWRDVNGDGLAGFSSDLPEGTRTRDELQARLDFANLAGADALISIHINSPTEGGQRIEIAFSETFYTDETPWGVESTARLAEHVQAGVMDRVGALATYERGDRGTTAHNFYLVAPPLVEPTEERPDPWRQPTRGALMPVVLAEVGSITLRAEHDLLATADGQAAVADGLHDGLAAFFAQRELAARIGLADGSAGAAPPITDGDGPPFWAPLAPDGAVRLRITNTGTADWAAGAQLVSGWEISDEPYLYAAPDDVRPLAAALPALAPGESVEVDVDLGVAPGPGRALAWISLSVGNDVMSDHGSPALQLASRAP
ncbi:MAG: N-acetylmuramoyl-L-alanine amidase family protein [Candidatus Limnocylindria bacterium]